MFKKMMYRVINKKTPEQKWKKRIELIQELIEIQAREKPTKPNQCARNIAEDFYLDSAVVIRKDDGTILMSTKGDSFDKIIKSTALTNQIQKEFPEVVHMVIKDNGHYNVLYTEGDLLYLLTTPGEISAIETKKIVENLKTGMDDFSLRG